mgnify:CR=1 FL=1
MKNTNPYGTDDLARDLLTARNQLAAAQTQNEQARAMLTITEPLFPATIAAWRDLRGEQ